MVSLLESQVKKLIGDGFKGQLLPGVYRDQLFGASSVDGSGNPVGASPESYTCEGIVDTYSKFIRAQAGIPETDVKILIIAQSLSVRPQQGRQVMFRDRWYQIRSVDTDPAEATWEMQCFEIPDPTS